MVKLFLLASVLAVSPALAQAPGSCALGSAQRFLSANDVQASVFNTGGLFFGGSTTNGDGYIVPKSSGASPLYAATLWVGGTVGGEVRTSAARYGRYQMWPGPLDAGATLPDAADCSAYDRIWVVSEADIASYEQGSGATTDLREWPVGLGAPAVDASGDPVAITGRGQTLDLAGGERPDLPGTQAAFWVMNDVGGTVDNTLPNGQTEARVPLGVEVAVLAYAIARSGDPLHRTTFYRYTLANRSTATIDDLHLGFFVDPDLGSAPDDYVGVDEDRGLAFVYNQTPEDFVYGTPPALGFDLLGGLYSFTSPLKSGPEPYSAPDYPEGVYNRLRGRFNDGTPIREGGYGYPSEGGTGEEIRLMFPGDPVTGAYWSEVNIDGTGTNATSGDRRLTLSAPPVTLKSGDSTTIELAILFAQGTGHLDSITKLREASDAVQSSFNARTGVAGEDDPQLDGLTLDPVFPNPISGTSEVVYTLASPGDVELTVFDALGRRVAELADARQPEGTHTAQIDARALSPGVYVIRLRAGGETRSTRVTIVR